MPIDVKVAVEVVVAVALAVEVAGRAEPPSGLNPGGGLVVGSGGRRTAVRLEDSSATVGNATENGSICRKLFGFQLVCPCLCRLARHSFELFHTQHADQGPGPDMERRSVCGREDDRLQLICQSLGGRTTNRARLEMHAKTTFLNVDLDVSSPEDLAPWRRRYSRGSSRST